MARVLFYSKPGCKGGTRQKVLLTAAGHEVVAYDLLTEPWTLERLRSFFGDRPITEWFNASSPKIKSGEIVPQNLDEQTALFLMLRDPLLIRRPLIQVGDRREVGFDVNILDAWIGLKPVDESFRTMAENLMSQDLQGCAHGQGHSDAHHHDHQGNCNHHTQEEHHRQGCHH